MDAVVAPWMTAQDVRSPILLQESATQTLLFHPRPPLRQYQPAPWSLLPMDPAETSTLATVTPTRWDTAVVTCTDVVEALLLTALAARSATRLQENAMPLSHLRLLQALHQRQPLRLRSPQMDPAETFIPAPDLLALLGTPAATNTDAAEAPLMTAPDARCLTPPQGSVTSQSHLPLLQLQPQPPP